MYNASVEFTASDFLYPFGIAMFKSKHIFLHSLTTICDSEYCKVIDIEQSDDILALNVSVTFGYHGLFVKESRNINISNTEVLLASSSGIVLYSTIATNITNVVIKQPRQDGIYVESSQYTSIFNTVVIHAEEIGIWLLNSTNADIVNTSVFSSGYVGLDLSFVHHVTVAHISISESFNDGIDVFFSTNITFSEISVIYTGINSFAGETQKGISSFNNSHSFGLFLKGVHNAVLYSVRVTHSRFGIGTVSCFNITIKNITLTYVRKGIISVNSSNIHISYSTLNTSKSAIQEVGNEDSLIANVTVVFIQYQEAAVTLIKCYNVQMKNISLVPMRLVEVYQPEPAILIASCNSVALSKSVFTIFSYLCTITGRLAVVVQKYNFQ